MRRPILVTGANGFVGSALVDRLQCRGAVRRSPSGQSPHGDLITIDSIDGRTDWQGALDGMESVVHAAARVHVMKGAGRDDLAAFQAVNTDGTLNLARQAAARGVRRFVFISSVKVNGEHSAPGAPFREDDVPGPRDAYGLSKLHAEQALLRLAESTPMEIVIVRPPLVYGPGVKANFETMMRWISRGLPLPFGSIRNQRSLVALDNLVDLVATCISHPAAANQVFLAGDGEDFSTPDLCRRIGTALGHPARLLPVPPSALEILGSLIARREAVSKLTQSLQVSIGKARERLGWSPPVSADEGLRRAAAAFVAARGDSTARNTPA